MEKRGKPKTWVYVRVITGKASAETAVAILSIIDEINHSFRTQAVWSLHSDQGKEFLNQAVKTVARERGLHDSSGPGYDPDSNARAERGVGLLKDTARRLLLDANLGSKWWGYAMLYAALLHRLPDQGRSLPPEWPPFGALVTALVRNRPRDDFAPRGYVGRFLGIDTTIPLGAGKSAAFVERPDGKVESNSTFHAVTAEAEDLPGYPAQQAEVEDDGYSCPACRGRFAPHTRVGGECRRAPDEAEEVDPDIEDAWFQGEDGDSEVEEEKIQEVTGQSCSRRRLRCFRRPRRWFALRGS